LPALFSFSALGHNNENHNKDNSNKPSSTTSSTISIQGNAKKTLEEIDQDYQSNVKPLIIRACYNCHSSQTNFPWYYDLPIIKGQIDKDIKEAKKHLDFGDKFPFISHAAPKKDLTALRKTIVEGTMPPFKYKIMHFESWLSDTEKKSIISWIDRSLGKLK
jgi:hypothetical protein